MSQAIQQLDFMVSLIDKVSGPSSKMETIVSTVTDSMHKSFQKVGYGAEGIADVCSSLDRLIVKTKKLESTILEVNKAVNLNLLKNVGLTVNDLLTNKSGSSLKAAFNSLKSLSMSFEVKGSSNIALRSKSFDKYIQQLGLTRKEFKNLAGIEKQFQSNSKITVNQVELMSHAWDRLLMNLSNLVLPSVITQVTFFSDSLTKVSAKIERWSSLFPTLSSYLGAVLGVVVSFIAGLYLLSKAITFVASLSNAWALMVGVMQVALSPFGFLLKAFRMGWLMATMQLVAGKGVMAAMRIGLLSLATQLKINITSSYLFRSAVWAWNKAMVVASFGAKLMVGAFKLLKLGIFTVIPAIFSFTVALLANPITWVVLSIVALVAGLVGLIAYWDELSAVIVGVGTDFLEMIAAFSLVGTVLAVWDQLPQWWNQFSKWLSDLDPFSLVNDSIDWMIDKLNLIPGVNIKSAIEEPKLPKSVASLTPKLDTLNGLSNTKVSSNVERAKLTVVPVSLTPKLDKLNGLSNTKVSSNVERAKLTVVPASLTPQLDKLNGLSNTKVSSNVERAKLTVVPASLTPKLDKLNALSNTKVASSVEPPVKLNNLNRLSSMDVKSGFEPIKPVDFSVLLNEGLVSGDSEGGIINRINNTRNSNKAIGDVHIHNSGDAMDGSTFLNELAFQVG